MSATRRLADLFGLKRNLIILLIATFAIGAGEELWMRFLPKYLQSLGATVFIIGLFDATIRNNPLLLNQTINSQLDTGYQVDNWTFTAQEAS